MKKISVLSLAALCTAVTLLSCEKEMPANRSASSGSDVHSAEVQSLATLKPNYVYTLAGNIYNNYQNNGKYDQASFENLAQLIADDGYLYALDQYSIRKIRISDSTVTLLAGNPLSGDSRDGLGAEAVFVQPTSLAFGPDGNIYVSDYNRVRKVTKEGMVTTVAGSTKGYQDGPLKTAKFERLTSIAVCVDGTIYVVDDLGDNDNANLQIRRISNAGKVSTITSGGPAGPSSSWNFQSLAVLDGTLYAAGNGIYRLSSTGKVIPVKQGITVFTNSLLPMRDGSFFIGSDNQIKIVEANGSVTVFAGVPFQAQGDPTVLPSVGPADSVNLYYPSGFAVDNGILYFCSHVSRVPDPEFSSQPGQLVQMIALPK